MSRRESLWLITKVLISTAGVLGGLVGVYGDIPEMAWCGGVAYGTYAMNSIVSGSSQKGGK